MSDRPIKGITLRGQGSGNVHAEGNEIGVRIAIDQTLGFPAYASILLVRDDMKKLRDHLDALIGDRAVPELDEEEVEAEEAVLAQLEDLRGTVSKRAVLFAALNAIEEQGGS